MFPDPTAEKLFEMAVVCNDLMVPVDDRKVLRNNFK